MKVGDLITFFNPRFAEAGFEASIGLVVGSEASGMIRVLFNGHKHPRWVCPTQCRLTNENENR